MYLCKLMMGAKTTRCPATVRLSGTISQLFENNPGDGSALAGIKVQNDEVRPTISLEVRGLPNVGVVTPVVRERVDVVEQLPPSFWE